MMECVGFKGVLNMLEVICKELGVGIGEQFIAKPIGEDKQWFRLDEIYGLLVYNTQADIWVGAENHICNQLITGKLKPIISNFVIGDFVTIFDVGESYTTYIGLIEDEIYFNKFVCGSYPENTIYKIIDIKTNKPNNDIICVIESFEGKVYLISEKGIDKVDVTNKGV